MNKSADEQVVKSSNIYQFNITLHHIKPRIWRRIQVPEDYNFKDLHYAIQDAMGWKDCHLHQFEMRNPKTGHKDLITAPNPDYTYNLPIVLEDKAKIAEYFLSPKDKAIYEYDLGDSWTHDIVLEQILPAVTYPQCLAGKGACPKEDDDRSCYSSTDKFEPKSVKFNKRACQGNRLCPPADCEEVDRGNDFNAGDFDHKLIRSSNETVNKATEVRLIKRACPPTDCGGVDRGNDFNPKLIRLSTDKASQNSRECQPENSGGIASGNDIDPRLISLYNGADLNSMRKTTEASQNNRACPPEDCGVVNGSISFHSKDPELIRRSIAEHLYSRDKATETSKNSRACQPENSGGIASGNDIDPRLISLHNGADLNSMRKTTEVVKSCNVYQFQISLHHFKPKIWRRVQVPGEYSFKDLHFVIQKAMGWKNCHLHRFTMKNPKTGEEDLIQVPDLAYRDICVIRNERETKIAEHFLAPKDKAIYEYDLGFSWTHDIVLEKILPAVASITYPRCLAGRRKTPKEDPTYSEQEDEELFYPNPDEDKFDPKSVKFT